MSVNWKRGLVIGIAVSLYSLAAQNFWPDLNNYLTVLIGAIVGAGSYQIAEVIFEK